MTLIKNRKEISVHTSVHLSDGSKPFIHRNVNVQHITASGSVIWRIMSESNNPGMRNPVELKFNMVYFWREGKKREEQ